MHSLRQIGCITGFHPGYRAAEDSEIWRQELDRLRAAIGEPISGGRQHYLRVFFPTTWRFFEQAGLKWGSNMAFSATAGFRAGTAGPYRTWDVLDRRVMDYVERPLVFMDTSYRNRLNEGLNALRQVYLRSGRYGHRMTVLFHNTSLLDPLGNDSFAEAKTKWLEGMAQWK